MKVSRRRFLTSAAACCATAPAAIPAEAEARGNKTISPDALGLLFDSTLCVGCKNCVTACKQANGLPLTAPPDKPYLDDTKALSTTALNVIKMYRNGVPKVKDRAVNGFAFAKQSCMHCVDPTCVSVCPVSAMKKDATTGVVSYDKDACIGCRYCVASCPFRIPRFDYHTAFPEVHKCQLCRHLWPKGQFSACASSCPTGATLFGPVRKLKAEAEKRLALRPGEPVRFPRRSTETGEFTRTMPAAEYVQRIYGEREGGGTQVLMVSGVPFDMLGLPELPDRSYASRSETVQHTLYRGAMLPALVLGGLIAVTARNARHRADDDPGPDETDAMSRADRT